MSVFTVHLPKVAAGETVAPEKIVFLRDGFSTPAFLFGPFWLAWKRAFLPAALVGAVFLALEVGGPMIGLSGASRTILSLVLGAAMGFEGVRLVAWSLARKGYTESAVVFGHDADEAEEAFFIDWRDRLTAPVSPAPLAQNEGTPA
jgi:hypothetical protein